MQRFAAEMGSSTFAGTVGRDTDWQSAWLDPRITITEIPMDPDLGFPSVRFNGNVYNPVTWIEHGVLQHLAYRVSRPLRNIS